METSRFRAFAIENEQYSRNKNNHDIESREPVQSPNPCLPRLLLVTRNHCEPFIKNRLLMESEYRIGQRQGKWARLKCLPPSESEVLNTIMYVEGRIMLISY